MCKLTYGQKLAKLRGGFELLLSIITVDSSDHERQILELHAHRSRDQPSGITQTTKQTAALKPTAFLLTFR